MGIIDIWAEDMFRRYGEKWIPIEVMKSDNKEGLERISEFFDRCEAVNKDQPVLAYINIESLFSQEYREHLNNLKNKEIIYNNKNPLTFLVCGNHVFIEDTKQIFIKYHTKLLGKNFSERFNNIN